MRRPLSRLAKLFKDAKPPVRKASAAPRFALEALEDRSVPANFTIMGNTVTINLNVDETLTVTDNDANVAGTTAFMINNGNFVQMGGMAPVSGAGTATLVVNDADLATALTINNSLAPANSTNGVIFTGNGMGENVTSTTISVSIADADLNTDVDNIQFNGLRLISNTGVVTVSTVNGSITSPGMNSDVIASALGLSAPAGVGTAAAPVLTTVANLEAASTGTTGVFVTNTTSTARPDLTIGGAVGTLTGIMSGGPIAIVSQLDTVVPQGTGDINVSSEGVTAAGNISLTADGSVLVNAPIMATGMTATVTIVADADNSGMGNITTQSQGTIASAGGQISIGPGGVAMGGAQVVTIGGSVTVNGGIGGITVQAEGNANINAALSLINPTIAAGSINVVADSDNSGAGDVTTMATTGTISTAGGQINIGPGGVAMGGAQVVTINAPITVTGGGGGIAIAAETNALINGTLSTLMGNITGVISVTADSDDNASGDLTTTAAVSTSGGAIVLGGAGGAGPAAEVTTIGAPVTITNGLNGITVRADGNTLINAAVSVGGSNMMGGVTVVADDDNSGAGDITSNASGAISTTGGSISIGGTGAAIAQVVNLAGAVTVTGGGGSISIQGEGNVIIGGNVSVANTMGLIAIGADTDDSGAGDITTTGAISTQGGGISIGGTAPAQAQVVTIGGTVTVTGGGGGITVNAEGNTLINAAVSTAMGNTAGMITINADANNDNAGGVTTTAAISTTGGGIVIGGSGPVTANPGAVDVTLGAGVTVNGGNGSILIQSENTVLINAPVMVAMGGTGGIIVIADETTGPSGAIGNITTGVGGTISTVSGSVLLQAADSITVGAAVSVGGTGTLNISANAAVDGAGNFTTGATGTLTTAGGVINILATDVDLGAAVTTTGTNPAMNAVNIAPRNSNPQTINLGTDPANPHEFGLTDADIDRITTGILRIGQTAAGAVPSAAITTTAPISSTATTTLALQTAANILDGTAAETPDVTVTNLVLRTATGVVDLVDDLDTAVTNLALTNTTNGTVNVGNQTALLNITTVDGTVGATQTNPAGLGSILISNVLGAGGDIVVVENVTNAGTSVLASVQLSAGGALTVNANRLVQTVTGSAVLNANFTNPTGTADIVLATGSSVRTAGNITVAADQNGAATVGGGMVTMNTGTVLGGVAMGARATNISILGGEDVLVTTALATTNITAASGAALVDDNVETTILDSLGSINLTSGGRTGSNIALTPAEIVAASGPNYLAMIDVAYNTDLILDQVNTLGNMQIRKVGGTLVTGNIDTATGGALIGAGNQLTIVSVPLMGAGGAISVAGNFTLNDGNLLFATAEGLNNIAFAAAGTITNNGTMSTSTLLAAGGMGAAITTTAMGNDGTANFAGTNLVLSTTGGSVGDLVTPLEIDARMGSLSGNTTLGGATGGSFIVTDTLNGLRVGQVNAGTTGNVTLNSMANQTPTGSNITAVTPNDGVAEVIGNIINLNTNLAPATGAGGQIGAPGGLFFELDSNLINATTNASNVWIAEVGVGATSALGNVNIGTAAGTTAFIRASNGATLTNDGDAMADVLAPTVNLSTGTGGGNFGTSPLAPIQIDAGVLVGNLANGGNAFVQDTLVGLTVQRLTTTAGDLSVETLVGDLQLGNGTTITAAVQTATGTATLTAAGAILGNASAGPQDVIAATLSATAANGVGTALNPLLTSVANLAATGGTGGVFVNNTGALTVTTLGALAGVTGTAVTVANTGATTVSSPVTGTNGDVTVTATTALTSSAAIDATNGAATVTAGTALLLNTGGSVTADASVTLMAGTTLTSSAAVDGTTATLTATGALTTNTGGTVNGSILGSTLTGGSVSIGAAISGNGGTAITANAGNLSLGGAVTGGSATLSATGNLSSTSTGTINIAFGSVTTNAGGTTTLGGTVNASGIIGITSVGAISTTAAVSSTLATVTANATAGGVTTMAPVSAGTTATLTAGAGAVMIGANVTGTGGVTATATDAAGAGQNVTVAMGATVSSTNSPISLMAGDDLTIAGTITSGSGVVTLMGDAGNLDAGTGTTVNLTGTVTSTAVAQISGGGDVDTFNITPQTGAALNVVGGNPTMMPGDTLLLDTAGATPTVLTPGMTPDAGTFSFGGGRQNVTFTGIETAATATVTVTATDATASEVPGNPGQFTVTRVGDTSADLTVNLMITGTATNGADYTAIPTTVVIPAGMGTATIDVSVLADALTEGNETVIVTVAPGTGYVIGTASMATVTITDNPPPPPAPPAPAPVPPVFTGAAIINGVLTIAGPTGAAALTFPVPAGSSVLFTDVTGDGKGDVILFLPGIGVVALSGQNGVVVAFGSDINGDKAPDLLIFNPTTGAPRSFTDGRTGQTIPLGN